MFYICKKFRCFDIKSCKIMNNKLFLNNERKLNSNSQPEDSPSWRGSSMEEIYRYLNEFELDHIEPVRPTDKHTVLHNFPIRENDTEPPKAFKSYPKWDAMHVRMPCSEKSQYPVTGEDGSKSIESRWGMIREALQQPIRNSDELQKAILSYNTRYADQWTFRALHKLFKDVLDESEACVFFEDLLPRIIRLALRLPMLVQSPIPLLKQGQNHSITLTQEQISCLLANAFLCTYPRRNTLKRNSEYRNFPDINFNRLFQSSGDCVLEKLKCICHYFKRVCPTDVDSKNVPTGVLTFARRSLPQEQLPNWSECDARIGAIPLHITSDGTIEDQGVGLLQVDFANKYLGGGVLGSGCVQEEIRFVICPELLVSKLFTECLKPNEALLMVGAERYNSYTGYASTFEWAGNFEDTTPYDSSRRRSTHIVAIDALSFVQSTQQFREDLMLRELNKAYVGFYHPLQSPAPGVASGNWGCGAFGGDAKLKALLQLIVCTVVQRPLVYYTFGDAELRDVLYTIHKFFVEENIQVNELWSVMRQVQFDKNSYKDLYSYIVKKLKKSRTSKTLSPKSQASNCDHHYNMATAHKTFNNSNKILESAINEDATTDMSSNYRELTKSDSENDIKSNITKSFQTKGDCILKKGSKQPDEFVVKSRQRSLLEMLDKSYSKEGQTQPSSKRQCVHRDQD